jgi:hypothetical protein
MVCISGSLGSSLDAGASNASIHIGCLGMLTGWKRSAKSVLEIVA